MKFTLYQVDAFTNMLFHGNPAAVIPLENWLPDELMLQIAAENNLSETAFFVPSVIKGTDFEIRWFTPELEINLCGHATLASAFVIFNYLDFKKSSFSFNCQSGKLSIEKRADVIVMDFPSWKPERVPDYPEELVMGLRVKEVVGVYKNRDLVVELADEKEVADCKPDFALLRKAGNHIIVTAPGSNDTDFVSRFFAPAAGINEDPVTGSAHSQLIPFWAEKLNKKKMFAKQLSPRGGDLWCGLWGDRVSISGQCVFYMRGEIEL